MCSRCWARSRARSRWRCDFTTKPARAMVIADLTQVQQALTNLIVNAIQASAPGGKVDVTLRSARGRRPHRGRDELDGGGRQRRRIRAQRARLRAGHAARRAGARVRAVLHDQAGGRVDRAWACRWRTTSSKSTAAGWRPRASPAAAAGSCCSCRGERHERRPDPGDRRRERDVRAAGDRPCARGASRSRRARRARRRWRCSTRRTSTRSSSI